MESGEGAGWEEKPELVGSSLLQPVSLYNPITQHGVTFLGHPSAVGSVPQVLCLLFGCHRFLPLL